MADAVVPRWMRDGKAPPLRAAILRRRGARRAGSEAPEIERGGCARCGGWGVRGEAGHRCEVCGGSGGARRQPAKSTGPIGA